MLRLNNVLSITVRIVHEFKSKLKMKPMKMVTNPCACMLEVPTWNESTKQPTDRPTMRTKTDQTIEQTNEFWYLKHMFVTRNHYFA